MNDTVQLRQDARIIGLVGLAHGTSHFYHVILAALIPWLRPEFHLSYAELGVLMTIFFAVSGVGQVLTGFIVDRVGARAVLLGGLGLLSFSALLLSSAHTYAQLMLGAFVAGVGNSVFHPADYTLLNQRVSQPRLAHGFSVHGFSGNVGWAVSPLFLTWAATQTSWRMALLYAALVPCTVLLVLLVNRRVLRSGPVIKAAPGGEAARSFDFLKNKVVWTCFAFFVISAVALAGMQSFAATSLQSLYGMSAVWATAAYTCFMGASAVGFLCGGFLAAASRDPERIIVAAFALAAVLALVLAAAVLPNWGALLLMGLIGLATGIAGPSRDLMIRAAATQNATGRVFGLVYSGLDSGLALGPLLFGAMMDAHHPAWVFVGIGLFQALVIVVTQGLSGSKRPLRLQKAA